MKILNYLKDNNLLKPALGLFLVIFFLVFFLVFNYGLSGISAKRIIASDEVMETDQMNDLVVKNLAQVLKSKNAHHSERPSEEEQFLFGFLKGNYKAFKVKGAIIALTAKDGLPKNVFKTEDEKRKLIHEFKSIYLPSNLGLADPVESRVVASNQISYSLVQNSVIVGRLDIRFTEDHELIDIKVGRL